MVSEVGAAGDVAPENAINPGLSVTGFIAAAMDQSNVVILAVDDFTYSDQGWYSVGATEAVVDQGRIVLGAQQEAVAKTVTAPRDATSVVIRVEVRSKRPDIVIQDVLDASFGSARPTLTAVAAHNAEGSATGVTRTVLVLEHPLRRDAPRTAAVTLGVAPEFDGEIAIEDVVVLATVDRSLVGGDVLTSTPRYRDFASGAPASVDTLTVQAGAATGGPTLLGGDGSDAGGTSFRFAEVRDSGGGGGQLPRAPEIGADDGLGALALVGALAALFWERRRRG